VEAWEDGALAAGAADWLGPFLWEGGREGEGPALEAGALYRALETRLGPRERRELDTLVPALFKLPNGKSRALDYGGGTPFLSLRLQDAFGIAGETAILSVPITFELLSPADRPIQITRDLPGFWRGSYVAVRRELRGRYPRHFWPPVP
jgi:ATP-dependent helicase HrpB